MYRKSICLVYKTSLWKSTLFWNRIKIMKHSLTVSWPKNTRSKRSVGALFQNTPTCCWAQTPRSQRAGVYLEPAWPQGARSWAIFVGFLLAKKMQNFWGRHIFRLVGDTLGIRPSSLWKHTDLPVQRLFGRPVSTAFPGRNSRPTVTQPFNMLGEPKIHQNPKCTVPNHCQSTSMAAQELPWASPVGAHEPWCLASPVGGFGSAEKTGFGGVEIAWK